MHRKYPEVQELVQEINRGDCVLFVGAGLSMGAGLPSWTQLLAPLAVKLKCPSEIDPLTIAQVFEYRIGRRELVQHICDKTDTSGIEPTENHHKLARMPFNYWITTNYDSLIEETFKKQGRRFDKVVKDQDLSLVKSYRSTLLKLHGDRESPTDSIVITKKDHLTYFKKHPRIHAVMSQLLTQKSFLFLGYSVNDPDFNWIHSEIAIDMEIFHRRAYAVLFDAEEITVDDLRARNIDVINLITWGKAPFSCLSEFLDHLDAELSLSPNVPKETFNYPEAEQYVPRDILRKIEDQGMNLYRCVEYLVHCPLLNEKGQPDWPRAGWVPPEKKAPALPGEILLEYHRTDTDGNFRWGFAFVSRT